MLASKFLEERTGRGAAWWVAAVQKAVQENSSPSDDPNHDQTDLGGFLARVSKLVEDSLPRTGEAYDPNMRAMAVLSLVSALWFGRLQYAKAHDPARPSSTRRQAYAGWVAWALALGSIPLDEREDATHFPGQRWDFPFTFESESGNFI